MSLYTGPGSKAWNRKNAEEAQVTAAGLADAVDASRVRQILGLYPEMDYQRAAHYTVQGWVEARGLSYDELRDTITEAIRIILQRDGKL